MRNDSAVQSKWIVQPFSVLDRDFGLQHASSFSMSHRAHNSLFAGGHDLEMDRDEVVYEAPFEDLKTKLTVGDYHTLGFWCDTASHLGKR